MPNVQTAVTCQTEVQENGRVELSVPFPVGTRVVVFVIDQPGDGYADLLAASQSSTAFWDHPWDDEDWNDG